MTQKHYVDVSGKYVGSLDRGDPPVGDIPDGWIEVDSMPEDGRQFWDFDGEFWYFPFDEIAISDYRSSLELTVITYDIHSSYCDSESETGLNECINNIMDNGGEKTISWQGPNGYSVATLADLSGLRKNVVDYRQKTRDAERNVLETHLVSPFASLELAIQFFDDYMES